MAKNDTQYNGTFALAATVILSVLLIVILGPLTLLFEYTWSETDERILPLKIYSITATLFTVLFCGVFVLNQTEYLYETLASITLGILSIIATVATFNVLDNRSFHYNKVINRIWVILPFVSVSVLSSILKFNIKLIN